VCVTEPGSEKPPRGCELGNLGRGRTFRSAVRCASPGGLDPVREEETEAGTCAEQTVGDVGKGMEGPWDATSPTMKVPIVPPTEAHATAKRAMPLEEGDAALKACMNDINMCGGVAQASVHRAPSVRMFMEQVRRALDAERHGSQAYPHADTYTNTPQPAHRCSTLPQPGKKGSAKG